MWKLMSRPLWHGFALICFFKLPRTPGTAHFYKQRSSHLVPPSGTFGEKCISSSVYLPAGEIASWLIPLSKVSTSSQVVSESLISPSTLLTEFDEAPHQRLILELVKIALKYRMTCIRLNQVFKLNHSVNKTLAKFLYFFITDTGGKKYNAHVL